jgi:hypothetical protein
MIDHVDVDLRASLIAVRDQGARPTCLAHAASAAHERTRELMDALSPEYLHFFATGGTPAGGCSMDAIAKTLADKGQPTETDCPYLITEPATGWRPPTGLQVFRRASEDKACDPAEIEAAIRAHQLPVLGMSLPESFFRPQTPWVISATGAIRGLHAVAAAGVGRHQGQRVILIRNSWGPSWGEGGYAWLDEAFVAQHVKHVLLLTHEVTL